MENATKALLIAAAVLIAILLISLGVGIFNKASETTDFDLSEYEIQAHNDKFDKHVGNNKTGSEVNAMLKEVFNYNLTQDDANTMIQVLKSTDTILDSRTTSQPKVPTNTRYNVTANYSNGIIRSLTISEVAGS